MRLGNRNRNQTAARHPEPASTCGSAAATGIDLQFGKRNRHLAAVRGAWIEGRRQNMGHTRGRQTTAQHDPVATAIPRGSTLPVST
ncbi:hypothetical protein GCM10027059_47540 [Myceligenerans halotolerans]